MLIKFTNKNVNIHASVTCAYPALSPFCKMKFHKIIIIRPQLYNIKLYKRVQSFNTFMAWWFILNKTGVWVFVCNWILFDTCGIPVFSRASARQKLYCRYRELLRAIESTRSVEHASVSGYQRTSNCVLRI